MNLPNKITIFRILLIPIFIIFLELDVPYRRFFAVLIFIGINLTDVVDGYIARKTNSVTAFGKIMDPLADKLLITSALIFLIGKGIVRWMAFVIIARELLVTGIRVIASLRDIVIPASYVGKAKMWVLVFGICAVILNIDQYIISWFGFDATLILGNSFSYFLMFIATMITIYSGIDYFAKARGKGLFKNI
jgi:CDP-diacylglycerol---glycerol-3-phosphate 3-phosphatidyltransferase